MCQQKKTACSLWLRLEDGGRIKNREIRKQGKRGEDLNGALRFNETANEKFIKSDARGHLWQGDEAKREDFRERSRRKTRELKREHERLLKTHPCVRVVLLRLTQSLLCGAILSRACLEHCTLSTEYQSHAGNTHTHTVSQSSAWYTLSLSVLKARHQNTVVVLYELWVIQS